MQGKKVKDDFGPLAGYRVLDLGSTVAGPFCARLLADFGAEVVKVEDVAGDPVRELGETVDGKSLYAATILRNKKIISIDLRKEEGRQLMRALVPHFDVVVENFRPGTLEKWGLGYDDLRKLRPDLIMTRISGFGTCLVTGSSRVPLPATGRITFITPSHTGLRGGPRHLAQESRPPIDR